MRAFVLGGGGNRGAYEVGMLEALAERGIWPDVVVGTSIGAVNGAALAADPTLDGVHHLAERWEALEDTNPFSVSVWRGTTTAIRSGTHVLAPEPAERFVRDLVGVDTFEELVVPFHCVAACIETSTETWFDRGPLVGPVMASSALPGVFPPRRVGDRHYFDGGLVNSIPVERAIELGAEELYVLQVGHISEPLEVPKSLFDVGMVSFELSRRHRFITELAAVPARIRVHVLPTGEEGEARWNDASKIRFDDTSAITRRITAARTATHEYLATLPAEEPIPGSTTTG